MHGGMVGAVLDETIGRAINLDDGDTWGVTVKFSMRLRRPVPLDREVKVVARITNQTSRTFEGTGEIILEDGTVAAEAEGVYVKLPIGEIASDEFSQTDWFSDPLPCAGADRTGRRVAGAPSILLLPRCVRRAAPRPAGRAARRPRRPGSGTVSESVRVVGRSRGRR